MCLRVNCVFYVKFVCLIVRLLGVSNHGFVNGNLKPSTHGSNELGRLVRGAHVHVPIPRVWHANLLQLRAELFTEPHFIELREFEWKRCNGTDFVIFGRHGGGDG